MARYINLDDLVVLLRSYADHKHINGHSDTANGILSAVSFIKSQPVSNVKEVVYGNWIRKAVVHGECNQCECVENHEFNFCPNCGADMRGELHG